MNGNYTDSSEHKKNARRSNVTQEKIQVDIGFINIEE